MIIQRPYRFGTSRDEKLGDDLIQADAMDVFFTGARIAVEIVHDPNAVSGLIVDSPGQQVADFARVSITGSACCHHYLVGSHQRIAKLVFFEISNVSNLPLISGRTAVARVRIR